MRKRNQVDTPDRNLHPMSMLRAIFVFSISLVLVGCSSFTKPDNKSMKDLKTHDEYEKLVVIKKIDPPPKKEEPKEAVKPEPKKKETKKKVVEKPVQKKKKPVTKEQKNIAHLPLLEDSEGFVGRRPVEDPFRVGEVNEMALSYLGMTAGYVKFLTDPFVEVNGKKSYHFRLNVKSSKGFSVFYKIRNSAETFMDYDELTPYSHEVHINESNQVKETRSFFDWENKKGHYWQKKITRKGEKSKKREWELLPFSQNLISSLFYLRNFTFKVGKSLDWRVADAGKQVIVKARVLRKEKVDVPAGKFDTNVVKIEYEVDGTFKQIGDVFLYITDDDRKHIVKIIAKIKIGSIKAESVKIISGS